MRGYRRLTTSISFKRHRFPPVIIQHAVWLYARFTLSFRDVEERLAERGIDVSNETLRRWFVKFGLPIARNLRHRRPRASARWPLDEMVINIRGRKYRLWRAVDDEGEVLDFLVQRQRCARSANRPLGKLLKKHGFAPERITTDELKSYPVAIRKARLAAPHDQGLRANNRAENSHQPVRRREQKCNGSSPRDTPNVSCRSTPLSTTPSLFNAISCLAPSSKSLVLRRLTFGGKAPPQSNPNRGAFLLATAVNVPMPLRLALGAFYEPASRV